MHDKIGKNIKHLIEESNMKVPDIALKAGIHKSVLYAYINDQYAPNVHIFKRLCQVLNCRYEDILGDVNEDSPISTK